MIELLASTTIAGTSGPDEIDGSSGADLVVGLGNDNHVRGS